RTRFPLWGGRAVHRTPSLSDHRILACFLGLRIASRAVPTVTATTTATASGDSNTASSPVRSSRGPGGGGPASVYRVTSVPGVCGCHTTTEPAPTLLVPKDALNVVVPVEPVRR